MRKLIQWTLVPVAVAALACKGDKPTQSSMTEDLKRDLQLASATQDIKISPDEVAPKAQREMSVRPKRAPSGPKVVRTEKPTVKASTTPTELADISTDIPEIQAVASAPAPSESPTADAPPMARPAPVPTATYPSAEVIPASRGAGGMIAGVFGAVIRGGVVGDDDHCDPRSAGNAGRRRPVGQDIFTMPGTIGMGGARGVPIGVRGRIR